MNRKYERHQKHYHSNWHKIGAFSLHAYGPDTYEGNIPTWVRNRLYSLLSKVGSNRRRWCERKFGQKSEEIIAKMTVSSNLFVGTQFLKGRHYLYKITFKEGGETNYGEVFRRPVKS